MMGGRLFVRAQNNRMRSSPPSHAPCTRWPPTKRSSARERSRASVLTPNRRNAIVFGGFAALAFAISVVGVAGALAFSVSWRASSM